MTENWTKYWRNSLADGERMERDPRKLERLQYEQLDLSKGKIPVVDSEALISRFEIKVNKRNGVTDRKDDDWITVDQAEVIISPMVLLAVFEHTKRQGSTQRVYPFWYNAVLFRNGHLSVPETLYPTFVRRVLSPAAMEDQEISLSSVDQVDEIMGEGLPEIEDWPDYWGFVHNFFEKVTGKALQGFQMKGVKSIPECIIAVDEEIEGASDGIIKLYDSLLKQKQFPTLFRQLTSVEGPELRPLIEEADWALQMNQHLGQMGDNFPLSFSQRQSVHHFNSLADHEILAINGPPGTGKTTLLQSIVANEYVKAAINGGDPFVMLACSTNNQAVTNIIHSFSTADSTQGELAKRWLPDIQSYALYMPSNAAKPGKGVHYVKNNGEGLPTGIETPTYLNRARKHYLKKASEVLGEHFTEVQSVVNHLQQALKSIKEQLDKGAQRWKHYLRIEGILEAYTQSEPIESYYKDSQVVKHQVNQDLKELNKQLNGYYDIRQNESLLMTIFSFIGFVAERRAIPYKRMLQASPLNFEEVNYRQLNTIESTILNRIKLLEKVLTIENSWEVWKNNNGLKNKPPAIFDSLDVSLRHKAFLMATHYWEGRWLLDIDEAIELDTLRKNGEPSMKQKFRRYAMLTPCFVATFYMAPKFFYYTVYGGGKYPKTPLLSFIDLLIVDEAGQVTPEAGGATFALAKKAVVVGDIKQINPIWKIPKSIDQSNLVKFELPHDIESVERLDTRGFTAATGSVMRLAQNASPFQVSDQEARGMMLVEHRRCYDEIIGYCNKLAYHGLLRPLRGPLSAQERPHPLPALGYVHIEGFSESEGGSRSNEIEARAIAQWLLNNYEALISFYQVAEEKLENYVAIITPFTAQKYLLKAILKKAGFDTKKLTIGTVHALQGAERPIILFSMVYASNEGGRSYFFDSGVNMLNVAVSRAKDSFVLIGDLYMLDEETKSPSGMLLKHLKEKGEEL